MSADCTLSSPSREKGRKPAHLRRQSLTEKIKSAAADWPYVLFVFHLALSTLVLAVFHSFKHPVFATIDDARLLYIYAGYSSGEPVGTFVFSNAIWGEIVATLYRLIPALPWYYLYHAFTIVLSNAFICFLITTLFARSEHAIWWTAIPCAIITFAVHYDASLIMHFEVTACLNGLNGILFLFSSDLFASDGPGRRVKRIAWMLASVLSMFFCMVQNKSVFFACFTYYTIMLVYVAAKAVRASEKGRGVRTACSYAAVLVIVTGVFVCSQIGHNAIMGSEWDEYSEYNPYRVSFSDYSHLTYKEDPELFESLSWSSEFYTLATQRYYLDGRFSVEALEQIVRPFDRVSSANGAFALVGVIKVALNTLRSSQVARLQFLLAVSSALLFIVFIRRRRGYRNRDLHIALSFFTVLCALILLAYLCWRGRLPLRAWETVALPVTVISWLSTLSAALLPSKLGKEAAESVLEKRGFRLGLILDGACILLCVVAFAYSAVRIPIILKRNDAAVASRQEADAILASFESYAMDHPDDLFVYGITIQNYNPFTLYPDERPVNTMIWGTSYAFTPVWEDQLALFGLEDFDGDTYANDNVYFVCKTKKLGEADADRLFAMLRNDYGYTSMDVVYKSEDGFMVVSFNR